MTDKQPMQADGAASKSGDGPEFPSRQGDAGESGCSAYPNPHTGKPGKKEGPGFFFGHDLQSEIAYSGGPNLNATIKEE